MLCKLNIHHSWWNSKLNYHQKQHIIKEWIGWQENNWHWKFVATSPVTKMNYSQDHLVLGSWHEGCCHVWAKVDSTHLSSDCFLFFISNRSWSILVKHECYTIHNLDYSLEGHPRNFHCEKYLTLNILVTIAYSFVENFHTCFHSILRLNPWRW